MLEVGEWVGSNVIEAKERMDEKMNTRQSLRMAQQHPSLESSYTRARWGAQDETVM